MRLDNSNLIFILKKGGTNMAVKEEIIDAYFDPENSRGEIEMILVDAMKKQS